MLDCPDVSVDQVALNQEAVMLPPERWDDQPLIARAWLGRGESLYDDSRLIRTRGIGRGVTA